jgi:hypothetical protein
MSVVTSQKISTYYERYKTIDVTYTKEIIQVTGMITQQVYLKCVGDFWPCVVYSSSFQGAKVVANIKSRLVEKLTQANNMASLRFCFNNSDTGTPVTFFVSAKVTGQSAYGDSKDVAMFTLQFTQRPPDDLIEIMGRVLDANINSAKRKDERITISADSARKLRILSKDIAVFIQGVPRRCMLRDLSFSGAKIIMMGVAKFLVDKDTAVRLDFDDPRESFLVRGKFVRAENVEGRKELVALAVDFKENEIPMGFKVRLNDYLSVTRADNREQAGEQEQPKAPPPKPQAPRENPPSPAAGAVKVPSAK